MSNALVTIRRGRSGVPDLLFDDQREARIDEIRPLLEHPDAIDSAAPLHRITVFATYRCNLACSYCKTIIRSPGERLTRPQKTVTVTVDTFRDMLAAHGDTPIRHLHFTGGEATMVRELPAMVRAAREHGVEQLSVTSNGALDPTIYRDLVTAGIDEIRISLDAAEASLGDAMAERRGAWKRTVETIDFLARMRRSGAPFFLIINSVISTRNRDRVVEIVRFLLDLAPDDIKLITEVDSRGALNDAGDERRIAALEALLADYPAHAYPLLRRKIRTVFSRDAIGLERMDPSGPFDRTHRRDWRCYIPLTERTVDGVYYYPCSVYLREGGAPLGRIDEPEDQKRRTSAAFVERADCLDDAICQRYCLHCTAEYNRRANAERRPARRRSAPPTCPPTCEDSRHEPAVAAASPDRSI